MWVSYEYKEKVTWNSTAYGIQKYTHINNNTNIGVIENL